MLAMAALAAYYAAGNLGVNTDTANMISATLPWRQNFNEYRDAFPSRDQNLLIVVDAATPAAASDFTSHLLDALRREPERYGTPLAAGEGEFFATNGLLYLPPAELAELVDRIAAAQPLLGLLKAELSGARVLDVAQQTLASGADTAAAAPFLAELERALASAAGGAATPLAWN